MESFAKYLPLVGLFLIIIGIGNLLGAIFGFIGTGTPDLVFGIAALAIGAVAVIAGFALKAMVRRRSAS